MSLSTKLVRVTRDEATLTGSRDSTDIEPTGVIRSEKLLNDRPFMLPLTIDRGEEVLGVNHVIHSLIPSHAEKCQDRWYYQKVPRTFTDEYAELIESSGEELVDNRQSTTHFPRKKT